MSSLPWAVLAVCSLLVGRWLFLLIAAYRFRDVTPTTQPHLPSVCVLVPAYNEAGWIQDTLLALRRQTYPNFHVLVIDDGSTDNTAQAARPHAQVLQLPRNVGKARALNAGLMASSSDLVLTVDADTQPSPDCLRHLVNALLSHPLSAGAAARLKAVGATRLSRWQDIEYTCNQNLDRRAQALLGTVTTAPGATTLWRRTQLERAGGFPWRTLTEDADLTLTLLRRGESTLYVPRAVSYTRVPGRWRDLMRQRRRWLHGNIQCAALHLKGLWDGPWALRLFGLPNFLFAHIGVYLLFPLSCLLLAEGVERWGAAACVSTLLLLFALDLLACIAVLRMERDERPALPRLMAQRLLFPGFLWLVFASVIAGAAAGVPVPWRR